MTTSMAKEPGEVQDSKGIGNHDFDQGKKISKFGYPVLHLHCLKKPMTSEDMEKYGLEVPRGPMYALKKMVEETELEQVF
jgi:hypothetical protein